MARLPELLVVSAALVLALPASADFYSHRYLGLSVLEGSLDPFCSQAEDLVARNNTDQQTLSTSGCEEAGTGWKVYGGWRWTPHLAFELDARQLPTAEHDFLVSSTLYPYLSVTHEVTTRMGNAHFVGHLPFGTSGLSLYGKIGGGFWLREWKEKQRGEIVLRIPVSEGVTEDVLVPVRGSFHNNSSGFHWGYGAGISYRNQNRWTLRVEWEAFPDIGSDVFGGQQDIQSASLGWSMHF